jgi:hypothetical protein
LELDSRRPRTPRYRPGWSMMSLTGRLAAVGCGKLYGCRLIGGSAVR